MIDHMYCLGIGQVKFVERHADVRSGSEAEERDVHFRARCMPKSGHSRQYKQMSALGYKRHFAMREPANVRFCGKGGSLRDAC